jgi:hypothetical protein
MAFEHNIKELYADVRKVIQNQERSILDRVDSTRQMALSTVDRERQDREKNIAHIVDQMRGWERAVKETEHQIMNNVTGQLNGLDEKIAEDHDHRLKFENGLRSDVEDGFRTIQQNLLKRGTEISDSQNELKQRVGNAVKSLQESTLLVEKTLDAKVEGVEGVLRAEIKSRIEVDVRLNQFKQSVNEEMESMQKVWQLYDLIFSLLWILSKQLPKNFARRINQYWTSSKRQQLNSHSQRPVQLRM